MNATPETAAPSPSTSSVTTDPNAAGTSSTTAESVGIELESPTDRTHRATKVVQRYTYWAIGVRVIPFPIVDLVAITGVQIKMIKDVAEIYGVKFSEHRVKSIVGSLMTAVGGVTLAQGLAGSIFKLIPGVGSLASLVTMPVIAGAFTMAIGRVFIMHFEAGGTLLDFDPDKMSAYFKAEFQREIIVRKKDPGAAAQSAPFADVAAKPPTPSYRPTPPNLGGTPPR